MQSDLLDVVIGVVFAWFLFSSVLFAVNEALVWATHVRSKYLWLAIGRMLDPSQSQLPRKFLDVSVLLPFGVRLPRGATGRTTLDLRPRASDGVSSPTASVAGSRGPDQGLLDRVQNVYNALAPRLNEVAKEGRRSKLTQIAGDALAEAVASVAEAVHPAELLTAARQTTSGWSDAEVQVLEAAVQPFGTDVITLSDLGALSVPGKPATDLRRLYIDASRQLSGRDVADFFAANPDLAESVRNAAAGVTQSESYRAVKAAVERWFDREMEQLSAHYRRQSRKILGVLAVPLVLYVQANVFGIVDDLRSDTALRQASVSAAIGAAGLDDLQAAIDQNCAPASGAGGTGEGEAETEGETEEEDPFVSAVDRFRCAGEVLDAASAFRLLPDFDQIRTYHDDDAEGVGKGEPLSLLDYGEYVWQDWGIVGRLVTLVALLFGAQFWYDVLRRLVGIRTVLTKTGAAAG
jgi:hypothetical protein